jgi:hypothetical protein|tara:strand:- start:928 stop:1182 length:255 start_codon:yes stop_codon:yes gene_type:complete
MSKTIREQIDDGKKEVNFHINVDTLKENVANFPIDVKPKDYLKSIIQEGFKFVELRSEGLKSVMAEAGINSTSELKALLKSLKK